MRKIDWSILSSALETSKEDAERTAASFRRRHELNGGKNLQVRIFERTVRAGGMALKCWMVVARRPPVCCGRAVYRKVRYDEMASRIGTCVLPFDHKSECLTQEELSRLPMREVAK